MAVNTKREVTDMHERTIITIGRQFGSGGHEIGQKLAQRLSIPFYDKELLELAAQQSGLSKDVIESYDEMPTSSLLYSLSMGNYGMGGGGPFNLPLNHQIFLAQFDAIQKLAEQGACVIVGRCADYALHQYPHLVSVFVHAELQKRIERVSRLYNLSEKEAAERIIKTDKKRASYHNFYATKKWGTCESYHLSVDSGVIGIDGAVSLICDFADRKEPGNLGRRPS